MVIREIQDINTITPLHNEIFGNPFPLSSYFKKCKTHRLSIFIYEEQSNLLGYSVIVDEQDKRNMYAWYGGVLPKYQGKGITQIFLEELIQIARRKDYLSVTLASTNRRPHMLRLAIKMGFDIVDLKKRDYGEGNKIYFRYKILPPYHEKILLTNNGKILEPVEIEKKLIQAHKNNCLSIEFDDFENLQALIYAIRYCNSFSKKPKLLIRVQSSQGICNEFKNLIKEYQGEIEIMN